MISGHRQSMLHSCPTDDELQSFLSGSVETVDERRITLHVQQCLECDRRLSALCDEVLQAVPAKSSLVKESASLRTLSAKILDDLLGKDRLVAQELEAGATFGRFTVIRKLGEGGLGVVYLVNDPKLDRPAALKIPRVANELSPRSRLRFLREAKTAASLTHPNVVTVYETGDVDGVIYILSAYCSAGTLAEYMCREGKRLPQREAATLIAVLADAVHYAHRCGVLHRDLKPGNVLLDPVDGSSVTSTTLSFVPRLADFGLAKLLEPESVSSDKRAADLTEIGLIVGTPEYMAPEQVHGEGSLAWPTDVYALGVMLYQMLTGRVPFERKQRASIYFDIQFTPVETPRSLRRDLSRDLEAICLRCLEKGPAERYAAAGDLAEDLQRFLRGEATVARPLNTAQYLIKGARRHPFHASAISVLILLLAGIATGFFWHYHELGKYAQALNGALDREKQQKVDLQRQRDIAERHEFEVAQQMYIGQIRQGDEYLKGGRTVQICGLLTESEHINVAHTLKGFEWHYLWELGCNLRDLPGTPGLVNEVRFSPDSRFVASRHNDSDDWAAIQIRDVSTGTIRVSRRSGHTRALSFSRDGRQLLTAHPEGFIQRWSIEQGERLGGKIQTPSVGSGTFSGDGGYLLLTTASGSLRVINVATGAAIDLPKSYHHFDAGIPSFLGPHTVALPRLVEGEDDPLVAFDLLDCRTGDRQVAVEATRGGVQTISVSANGQRLAAGRTEGLTLVFDLPSGDKVLERQEDDATCATRCVLSPDGYLAAIAMTQQSVEDPEAFYRVRLCRIDDSSTVELSSRGEEIHALEFSPDGRYLVYGGARGVLRLYRVRQEQPFYQVPTGHLETWSVDFSPDGRMVATAGDDHNIRLWDAATRALVAELRGHESLVTAVRFSPDGRQLISGSFDRSVRIWDVAQRRQVSSFTDHTGVIRCVKLRGDGSRIVSSGDDRRVVLRSLSEGTHRCIFRHDAPIKAISYHPTKDWLIVGDENGQLIIVDAQSDLELFREKKVDKIRSLAISPNGNWVAIGSERGEICLLSLTDFTDLRTIQGQLQGVTALAFSWDGRTLASSGMCGTIRLFQIPTGQELLTLPGPHQRSHELRFSRDDRQLAAACHDGTLFLWGGRVNQ